MANNNRKRILSVKVKRMVDDSPDTSYLGEYSNEKASEYSIDRAHSEDCASVEANHRIAVDSLERIIGHLNVIRVSAEVADNPDSTEWESLDQAIDILIGLQDDVMECDCGRTSWSYHEYRYFNPSQNYNDCTPEEIRQYVRHDYDRMERLNAGDWCYIGIRAQAEITSHTFDSHDGLLTQTITSGGLWGIESDSDASYLKEVEQEELSSLKAELRALGFSTRAIATAFKSAEMVDA